MYDICMEYEVPVMIHTGDAYSTTAKSEIRASFEY